MISGSSFPEITTSGGVQYSMCAITEIRHEQKKLVKKTKQVLHLHRIITVRSSFLKVF